MLSQCGKFEFNALVDREPMKMLKDGGIEPKHVLKFVTIS